MYPTKKNHIAAFTLIEMLIVVGIIAIITSLALAKNSQFNSTVLLSNAAYEMSFSIRQAQVYGLSVKEFIGAGGSTTFSVGYGVYFDSGTPLSYTLFADLNRDHLYQSPPDAIEEAVTLKRGYYIANLCGTRSGAEECGLSDITVAFERPNPDAYILGNGFAYDSARIVVASQGGEDTRSITVYATGQISVAGQ